MAAIEDIYQRVSQLEHVLLRPDTYVGSVEFTERTPMWIYDATQDKIVLKDIRYVPGLYKIFDEILVNAADNKQRDKKMNLIKVDINKEKNEISVFNNGKGIPVAIHNKEKMYVPEMIFGTLLTSSNYNDNQKKVTGGRNGYGAKLCNIFSTKFTVETSSKEHKKSFKQTWVNNMKKDKDGEVSAAASEDFTKITFQPDLAKFRMTELDDDIIGLMSKRAYDVAGSTKGVTVFLNGKKIPVQGFKQYVELYTKDKVDEEGEPLKVVHEIINDRWEVACTVSEKDFQQVSFVNSIATTKGGTHVDYIVDQIVKNMMDGLKKKLGKNSFPIKPSQVKNHIWVFVNCLIENPTFDSQTKETMTLQSKNFGSTAVVSEKFSTQVAKCGIADAVLSWVKFKQQEQANKKCSSRKTQKLKGIPKLEDANDAGTKNSHLCTLILTEGDSAKSLAVAGLGVIGRDHYGVFPLRGKMLNVRECSAKQTLDNPEVNSLLKILGLQYKLKYETEEEMKTLRYGKVMIMADQDMDGSHIKGLVINFIHFNWPNLMKKNFVEEFITPILKATKGKEELSFFSIPEYVEWRENTENWKTYRIKYYKGLGTSTSKEAKEYFSDMLRHRIAFKYKGKDCDDAVELAFSKKKIEARKEWLTRWMELRRERRNEGALDDYLYNKDTRAVSYNDFVNRELILFSNSDNERSIPSLVDGLKPGQRKVLFTCFKRADKKEVKVAQLAGAVGEMSAYHHGEQSLMSTIVNLAQDYVGTNNINLLLPVGQFGTRLQGGSDAASPRYIFTQLNPVTKTLFPPDDEHVLRFLFEENQRIEPEWYCPVIPNVLINGADGIGTGWSTHVPNFNPRDIVANIRRLINDEPQKPMLPWYKHFRGTIVQLEEQKYVCSGEIGVLDNETLEITELPVKIWTQPYKENVIEQLLELDAKSEISISDYKEYHTDVTVKFIVKMNAEKLRQAENKGLHNVFKLQKTFCTSSMVLFDASGVLRKFRNAEEICAEFFKTRQALYVKRKDFLVGMLQAQSDRLSEQARFIMMKIEGKIFIENKKKAAIIEQLIKANFKPDPVKVWKDIQRKRELEHAGEAGADESEIEEETEDNADKNMSKKVSDYDYLVGMAMWKLSTEDKDKLLAESESKKSELKVLESKSWKDLWNEDLDKFMEALEKQEKKEQADIEEAIKVAVKKLTKDKATAGRGKKAVNIFADVKPNPDAVRVEPTLDKFAAKVKTEKKVKKEGVVKKEGGDMRQYLADMSNNANVDDDIIPVDADGDIVDEKPKKKAPATKKPKVEKVKTEKEPKKNGTKRRSKENEPKEEKPKKKAQKKKIDSDDDDIIIDDDDDELPEEKPKKKLQKKKIDSDDDDIIIDDDDDELPGTPPPKRETTRRAAATKAVSKYVIDSEDEDLDDEKRETPPRKKGRMIVESDEEDFFV
uniref:DNA topoisomerase 2 n=1 Tax=Panagrolaimus sp. JU765 TaxID=591449 RepID=A0AC34QUD2_9BILA